MAAHCISASVSLLPLPRPPVQYLYFYCPLPSPAKLPKEFLSLFFIFLFQHRLLVEELGIIEFRKVQRGCRIVTGHPVLGYQCRYRRLGIFHERKKPFQVLLDTVPIHPLRLFYCRTCFNYLRLAKRPHESSMDDFRCLFLSYYTCCFTIYQQYDTRIHVRKCSQECGRICF